MESVKVEITIYDASSRVTDSEYTYVSGLALGGMASRKSYATYFGTEKKVSIRVVN